MSDYTELVQRLREQYMDTKQMLPNVLCHDSADAITQLQARVAELEAESGDITGKSGLLPESGWDAIPQILNKRADNARPLLNDIGQCIGYGRSCQILGELWDDHLQSAGFPRGRGRMENRPDVEYAEQQKQRAERAEADLAAARALLRQVHSVMNDIPAPPYPWQEIEDMLAGKDAT